jgi:uncharacterized protein (TIGR02452 family)
MGRELPSTGQPPAAFKKNLRSKKAKATINKLIPTLLTTHPRAKRGIEAAELIVQPPSAEQDSQAPNATGNKTKTKTKTEAPTTPLLISLHLTDPLAAALTLQQESSHSRVGILNMASPLCPGGGFLNGASGPEESLCMRSTLLPSLSDTFYRLPEIGGIYTPDVLVFRDEIGDELAKKDRWFVDVVSAGMLRFPSVVAGEGKYVSERDREVVVEKMRAVMRIFQAKGCREVVLGAWGCGGYGNPVEEVAWAWRRVLRGSGKKREEWKGIERVVFAIGEGWLATAFGEAFGEGLSLEERGLGSEEGDEREDGEAEEVREVREKVAEMKVRIQQARSPELKAGLVSILAGLEGQLPKGSEEATTAGEDTDSEIGGDDNSSDSDATYDSHGE